MKKIAINGFGRIGRQVLRQILTLYPDLEVAAINDLADNKTLAHLFKYDSVYGIYPGNIDCSEESIFIDKKEIKAFGIPEPSKLPWKDLGIDIVLECTGVFTDLEKAKQHLKAGAKKVIVSAPAKDVKTFILGVNEKDYKGEEIVSMASCTTNCLAPIAKILNDSLGIVKGFMTTCHAYTNDQKILDLPHKDLRRARAAGLSIIPTTTGAASAIGKVIPELEGKLDGIAMRVPTPTVSVLDLICELEKETTAEQVNALFKKGEQELKGILRVEDNPLVSVDFKGDTYSAIVDSSLTQVKGNLVKVIAWYDNEWGYATRLADFTKYISG